MMQYHQHTEATTSVLKKKPPGKHRNIHTAGNTACTRAVIPHVLPITTQFHLACQISVSRQLFIGALVSNDSNIRMNTREMIQAIQGNRAYFANINIFKNTLVTRVLNLKCFILLCDLLLHMNLRCRRQRITKLL